MEKCQYNLSKLKKLIEENDFRLVYQDTDKERNIGLQVYKRL